MKRRRCQGRGAQKVLTSGRRGPELPEPPTAPFGPLCPGPLQPPSRSGGSSARASSPPQRLPAATVAGAGGPDSRVPAPPPPPRRRDAQRRRSWRARRPGRQTSWAPHPRPSLASAARLSPRPPCLASPPPARVRIPGPVPEGPGSSAAPSSGSPRWPDCPRESRVCLRRPCPRGARAQPQVGGEVGVPGSPPDTHRGEGALRPRREPAPAASRALHVPAPRPRALARSVLARRAPEPRQRGARVGGAAWRAALARPRPRAPRPPGVGSAPGSVPGWTARRASGSQGSPAGCGRALAAARAGPPHRDPPPPPRPGPPRRPLPAAPGPSLPARARDAWVPSPGLRPQTQHSGPRAASEKPAACLEPGVRAHSSLAM